MHSNRRWLGLLFISLSVALIIVDSTIVAVTMPPIVADLGLTSAEVQWVQESYTLMFASLLLAFGSLADRVGRRAMLITGLVVFAVASLGIVVSTTGLVMIAWRIVQGVGGAMILPATLSLLNATFTGRERGVAFAVWGATIGGMAAVGPLLGGWLATDFSWHWAFGINPPLVVAIIVGLVFTIRESRDAPRGGIDWGGAALAVVMSAAVVFGLIEGRNYGWWSVNEPFTIGDWTWPLGVSIIPFVFALGLVLIGVFVWRGLRRERAGRASLLNFGLFRIASFRNGNLVAALVSLGEFGLILSLPLWMQFVLGYDPLHAGFAMLSLAVGSFVSSGLVTTLQRRLSAVWIVRLGLALEIVGILVVALTIGVDTPWWWIALGLGVYGAGVGFATAQLTGTILVDVPRELSGQASGTQSTSRQVGSALGIAILGTILFGVTGANLQQALDDRGVPDTASRPVVAAVVDSAGGAIPSLGARDAQAQADARLAFAQGAQAAAFTAGGFLAIALVASSSLGSGRRRHDDPTEDDDEATPASPARPAASGT